MRFSQRAGSGGQSADPDLAELQFNTERRLAALIREAGPHDRPKAYASAYDQLYRAFPYLQTEEREEAERLASSLGFLRPMLSRDSDIVEVGAGRGRLAVAVAALTRSMVALDVAPLADASRCPANMRHALFDGVRLPLASNSVDIVLSDNVLEHLHPDDAVEQMGEACRVLKPGGRLVLLTPNKVNGPHDVSFGFSAVPAGLHLKEYGAREIAVLLRSVGFASIRAYLGAKGRYASVPILAGDAVERAGGLLPRPWLRARAMRWLLPNRFTAVKPGTA